MNHEPLGPRITRFRIQAGLSKAELARRAKTTDVSITYWEAGSIKQIGHERLLALAAALNMTVSELIGDPLLPAYRDRCRAETLQEFAEHCRTLAENARENGFTAQADAVDDMAGEALERATALMP